MTKGLKLRGRKVSSVFLVLLMLVSAIYITPISVSAVGGVEEKLNIIKSVYPSDSYFTVSGGVCYSSQNSDCELANIPSRGGLPTGATVASVAGNAWSCCSFAKYVFYCTFGLAPNSCWSVSQSEVKIGDYIDFYSTSYGHHYGIYLGQDSTNWYIYDSNFTSPATNRIRYYGAIKKSSVTIQDIRHATNYDQINQTLNVETPLDLGTEFYALIINLSMWKPITVEQNKNVDIKTGKYFDCPDQIWKFERQSDGSYKIISLANHECLDVDGAGTSSGTNVQTFVDHNHDAQRWFIYGKNGGLVLKSKISNCVLDVNGGNSTDGTNIQVWEENDSSAQIFSVYKVETNQFAQNIGNDFTAPIFNTYRWKPITNDKSNNTIIDNEYGTANQLWRFLYQIDGSYKIVSCLDGKCLDVQGASYEGGANVQVFTDHNHDAQRWYIIPCNGGYMFQSKLSGFYLNLSTDGANIQLWDKTASESQVFSIYKGEECKLNSPLLKATVEKNEVSFSWNDVYGEYYYNLRIWKEQHWQGESFYDVWNIPANKTSTSVLLPAGKYEAYLDTGNYFEGKMSNIVCFEIMESYCDINLDGTIDIKDIVLMQRYLLGMVSLNAQQLECADHNNDGKFSLADIVAVQRYIMSA